MRGSSVLHCSKLQTLSRLPGSALNSFPEIDRGALLSLIIAETGRGKTWWQMLKSATDWSGLPISRPHCQTSSLRRS